MATMVGGTKANNGNRAVLVQYEYILPSVRNNALRLLLRVIAMMGKFVLRVKTGNNERKI